MVPQAHCSKVHVSIHFSNSNLLLVVPSMNRDRFLWILSNDVCKVYLLKSHAKASHFQRCLISHRARERGVWEAVRTAWRQNQIERLGEVQGRTRYQKWESLSVPHFLPHASTSDSPGCDNTPTPEGNCRKKTPLQISLLERRLAASPMKCHICSAIKSQVQKKNQSPWRTWTFCVRLSVTKSLPNPPCFQRTPLGSSPSIPCTKDMKLCFMYQPCCLTPKRTNNRLVMSLCLSRHCVSRLHDSKTNENRELVEDCEATRFQNTTKHPVTWCSFVVHLENLSRNNGSSKSPPAKKIRHSVYWVFKPGIPLPSQPRTLSPVHFSPTDIHQKALQVAKILLSPDVCVGLQRAALWHHADQHKSPVLGWCWMKHQSPTRPAKTTGSQSRRTQVHSVPLSVCLASAGRTKATRGKRHRQHRLRRMWRQQEPVVQAFYDENSFYTYPLFCSKLKRVQWGGSVWVSRTYFLSA